MFSEHVTMNIASLCEGFVKSFEPDQDSEPMKLYLTLEEIASEFDKKSLWSYYGGDSIRYDDMKMNIIKDFLNMTSIVNAMQGTNAQPYGVRKLIDNERERLWKHVQGFK